MSTPIEEGVNPNETGDETHSLTGHEPRDVNTASSSLNTPTKSEAVARQTKTATDPLTKKLDRLCDLMKELRQVLPSLNEEATGLVPRSMQAPKQ